MLSHYVRVFPWYDASHLWVTFAVRVTWEDSRGASVASPSTRLLRWLEGFSPSSYLDEGNIVDRVTVVAVVGMPQLLDDRAELFGAIVVAQRVFAGCYSNPRVSVAEDQQNEYLTNVLHLSSSYREIRTWCSEQPWWWSWHCRRNRRRSGTTGRYWSALGVTPGTPRKNDLPTWSSENFELHSWKYTWKGMLLGMASLPPTMDTDGRSDGPGPDGKPAKWSSQKKNNLLLLLTRFFCWPFFYRKRRRRGRPRQPQTSWLDLLLTLPRTDTEKFH